MPASPNLYPTDSRRPSYASSNGGGGGGHAGSYLGLGLKREVSASSSTYREKPSILVSDNQYGNDYGDPGPSSSSAAAMARRRKSGLKRRTTQLMALRFGWIVLVIWYEAGEFFSSLSSCKFPDSVVRTSPNSPPATHLVVLADPHVPHPRLSYPPDANKWVSAARQAMEELFMRKSWNVVMRLGRVDGVIVAGDMLDCGRSVMSDTEYDDYVRLYRSIFRLPPNVPMHYVPGNHDLPLGPNKAFSPHARDRYKRYFSPPNLVLDIANHSLILLDSVGLVEEDYRRYAAEMQFGEWDGVEGGVIEFVKDMGDREQTGPNILISHIPLARQEASTCGPLREKGRIVKGAGPGYRNLLGSETSRFLLQELKPSVVFSGDDHDYCEHVHADGTREVTIKSFSTTAGVRRPGFQLLSLVPPNDNWSATGQITHADRPCLLPDQLGVYTRVYLPVAILTVLYLLVTNARAAHKRWGGSPSSAYADKAWKSPGMTNHHSASVGTTATALFDRPVPYSLPSRRSNVSLNGLAEKSLNGGGGARSRLTSYGSELLTPTVGVFTSAHSAPVSPNLSPRPSFCEDFHERSSREEADLESTTTTPNLSRRNSYVWMTSAAAAAAANEEGGPAPSYFSHFSTEPGQYAQPGGPGAGGPNYRVMPPSPGIGLGLSSPHTPTVGQPTIRRVTSHYSPSSPLFMTPPGGGSRKNNVPRMVSLPHGDWANAGKSEKRSVLGFLADAMPAALGGGGGSSSAGPAAANVPPPVPVPGHNVLGSPLLGVSTKSRRRSGVIGGMIGLVTGFAKWAWRTRNGVVLRTGREVLGVAWPAAVVWVAVNALFFWR